MLRSKRGGDKGPEKPVSSWKPERACERRSAFQSVEQMHKSCEEKEKSDEKPRTAIITEIHLRRNWRRGENMKTEESIFVKVRFISLYLALCRCLASCFSYLYFSERFKFNLGHQCRCIQDFYSRGSLTDTIYQSFCFSFSGNLSLSHGIGGTYTAFDKPS